MVRHVCEHDVKETASSLWRCVLRAQRRTGRLRETHEAGGGCARRRLLASACPAAHFCGRVDMLAVRAAAAGEGGESLGPRLGGG